MYFPFNLVDTWWVHCIYGIEDNLALFNLLIEETMFLTQNRLWSQGDSQIGAMWFKVSRDWFQPDGSCHGLLGQIYNRDHKLHDSENKGKDITKEILKVKALKWENETWEAPILLYYSAFQNSPFKIFLGKQVKIII